MVKIPSFITYPKYGGKNSARSKSAVVIHSNGEILFSFFDLLVFLVFNSEYAEKQSLTETTKVGMAKHASIFIPQRKPKIKENGKKPTRIFDKKYI